MAIVLRPYFKGVGVINLDLISREKFEYIARKQLGYQLQDAEKDYFLCLVLEIIYSSPLKSKLIFKGGTAIHHCFLKQYRFSEDLDFTSLDKTISLQDLKCIFNSYPIFKFKKTFTSKNTLKIEKLKYSGILDTPNNLKIEVDKSQNIYLQPLQKKYKNSWGIIFTVLVMDPIEICAEKIRACNERFRYRDFYDLYLLTDKLNISINRSIKILPKKEIRKTIQKENLLKNLHYALEEVAEKSDTIAYRYKISNKKLINFIKDLKIPKILKNT